MPKIYLLDTNIISEMTKNAPDETVVAKIMETRTMSALCAVTWAEALFGAKRMPEGKCKSHILDFYLNSVQNMFPFIPFDEHAASLYSDLRERLERIGKPAQELDLQIASCAIANNLILVTRNTKDFEGIQGVSNLMMENWFS